ncbi:hypothetical protein L2E82_37744 [Cichorium intybus]|uniref:Uncharacterized protein n=1 Tax=Cichorium intybus TaxID=13427 RepID=A0ACB9AG06_CICIN|nr:hypothetical protein L2E82_37744 [Cichorium intybus]
MFSSPSSVPASSAYLIPSNAPDTPSDTSPITLLVKTQRKPVKTQRKLESLNGPIGWSSVDIMIFLSQARFYFMGRWGMVLVVSLVSLSVPNFADFLSLMSSIVCIVLGFVLPALFHLMVYKNELRWIGWVKDGVFAVLMR